MFCFTSGQIDSVYADSILVGSDYLTTIPVTRFDFGGPIGVVDLQSRPFGAGNPPPAGYPTSGLGNTDTIVQRNGNGIIPVQDTAAPSSATVPIQMVGLSLQNIVPLNIGGTPFDVIIHLTPGTTSPGEITITHNFLDNGSPDPEGTFTSRFFHVLFTANFTPRTSGSAFSIDGDLPLTGNGSWSHEPPFDAVLVTAPPDSQIANVHTPLPPGFRDFFPTDIEFHPGQGVHSVQVATVPEPSSYLLLVSGIAAAYGVRLLKKCTQ